MDSNTQQQSRRRRFISYVNTRLERALNVPPQQEEQSVQLIYNDQSFTLPLTPEQLLVQERAQLLLHNHRLRELRRVVLSLPRALRTLVHDHPLVDRAKELIEQLRTEIPDHIDHFLNELIN